MLSAPLFTEPAEHFLGKELITPFESMTFIAEQLSERAKQDTGQVIREAQKILTKKV